MKTLYVILFYQFIYFNAYCQNLQGNTWLFDNYNTITFKQDTTLLNQISPYPFYQAGSDGSNICDRRGNLLMPSGGCYILNKRFNLMKGGEIINSPFAYRAGYCDNLTGNSSFPFKQSTLFINYPNDTSKVVMFLTDFDTIFPHGSNILPLPRHLYYNIIDLNRENGLGEVVEKNKIAIKDTLSRGYVTATKHSNNIDWWVTVPKWKSNCYFITRINSQGLVETSKQCLGIIWDKENDLGGQVTFSSDGSKYARVDHTDTIVVYNFNTNNGQLSTPVFLSHPDRTPYLQGVCFSQNSRFLYVFYRTKIFQYDLLAFDVQRSMVLIADLPTSIVNRDKGAFQIGKLAPNGKIYISSPFSHLFLSVINNPNCKGVACNFEPHSLKLKFYNYSSLPNIPFFDTPIANYTCDSTLTSTTESFKYVKVYPNPANEQLIIDFQSETLPEETTLQITNVLGYVIYRHNNVNKQDKLVIPTSGWANSLYIVSVFSGPQLLWNNKIVVQH